MIIRRRATSLFSSRPHSSSHPVQGWKTLPTVTFFLSDLEEKKRWLLLFGNMGYNSIINEKSTITSLGKFCIEWVTNEYIHSLRHKILDWPRFSHIRNIYTNRCDTSSSSSSSRASSSFVNAMMKHPKHPPPVFGGKVTLLSPDQQASASGSMIRGIREIVVPLDSVSNHDYLLNALSAKPMAKLPNIFNVGGGQFYIRIAPTERPQISLQVDNLATAMEFLQQQGISFEKIGMTGSASGLQQIKLRTSSSSYGELDVRLTAAAGDPSPFFVEGEESVLDGTILSIQNPLVLGSESFLSSRGRASEDCWMEVKAMLKEPNKIVN